VSQGGGKGVEEGLGSGEAVGSGVVDEVGVGTSVGSAVGGINAAQASVKSVPIVSGSSLLIIIASPFYRPAQVRS